MLPLALVHEVRRLLEEGELSHRQIAIQTGVSRGSVYMVASGRRSLTERGKPAAPAKSMRPSRLPPTHRKAVRCAGCGGLVYGPCVLCASRRRRREQRLRSAEVAARVARRDRAA